MSTVEMVGRIGFVVFLDFGLGLVFLLVFVLGLAFALAFGLGLDLGFGLAARVFLVAAVF